ncbi:heavy-metal-associated domain-containing protein [Bacillus benzoevorans]|uniref:heavy-metal-associated domain-containing protein n=1 Tax=Bacillus benzoevorans TaxID=1456 RepID=UPI00366D797C
MRKEVRKLKDMTIIIKEATREEPIQELETILMQMDGIERALVDITDGEVKITYNESQVNDEMIKNRIRQHGLHLH